MARVDEDDDDWSVELDNPEPRDDGKPGPPDDWPYPSWYSRVDKDWYWRGQPDPCPVLWLGTADGVYLAVTRLGELRRFTARDLVGAGGLSDAFGGNMDWLLRHFRKWSSDKGDFVGPLQRRRAADRFISLCCQAGFYDGSHPTRGVGTWRGPDGPIVHAGDRIFHEGRVWDPGARLGDALFVIGPSRQAPAHVFDAAGRVEWQPAPAAIGSTITSHLEEWAWESDADRDLFQGWLHCSMLCAALDWLPHAFVQAPPGAGKSTLLRYARTVLGGAAHGVLRTYTKAFIEQHFTGTAAAILLDEMESDTETARISRLFELIRLMSDDGAEGGRGSAGGRARKLDVHGTVLMAATVTEQWRPQDRSRITLLTVRPFVTRADPPAPPELMAARMEQAAKMSPTLRARAMEKWELFRQNLKTARHAIALMGGQPRDADQLGHLIAGRYTMSSDEPLDVERDRQELERFRPFITSLAEAEDGEDEATRCLQTIFGLSPDKWIGGERVTIGQVIAEARQDGGSSWRRTLEPYGLKLVRNDGEAWSQAWLAVANSHPGLDELLTKYPQYQGKKRREILRELRSGTWTVARSEGTNEGRIYIGGVQTRYLLVPPAFLPSPSEGQ